MCWVRVEPTESGMVSAKMNLANAIAVEDHGDHFKINYAGEEGYYAVKKSPEMVEAYNSLVPEKSQPVVPAESEWVAQTAVPARVGIDQFRYIKEDGTLEADWAPVEEDGDWQDDAFNGWVDDERSRLELRCLKEVQP